jgi:hypothetical protein
MLLQIRPNAFGHREGDSVRKSTEFKKGLRWTAPKQNTVFAPTPAQSNDGFGRPSIGLKRRQLLQAGLLSLLPGSIFGLGSTAQAHPWADIPIERPQPFSEEELRQAQAAVDQARPHLFPFENALLDGRQRLLRKANDWVRQAQKLKAQGKDPRQVVDRAAGQAQRGDSEARAVLDLMRQSFH